MPDWPRRELFAHLPRVREAAWVLHQPSAALSDIPEMRRLAESFSGVEQPIPMLAIAYADAGRPAVGAALLREYQRRIAPGEWPAFMQATHEAWGYVALVEGRPWDAVRELRRADKGMCWSCQLPMLSLAYERAGQTDSAIALGERYLAASNLLADRYDGLDRPQLEHRLGSLYLQRGDKVNAARHLESFVRMWAHADADLRPQVDSARRELALARKGITTF